MPAHSVATLAYRPQLAEEECRRQPPWVLASGLCAMAWLRRPLYDAGARTAWHGRYAGNPVKAPLVAGDGCGSRPVRAHFSIPGHEAATP